MLALLSQILRRRSPEGNPPGIAGILILGLLLIDTVLFLQSLRVVRRDGWWIAHTHEVTGTIDSIWSGLVEFESETGVYVITGDPKYLNAGQTARQTVEDAARRLGDLIADNATQRDALADLQTRLTARLGFWATLTNARTTEGFPAARNLLEQVSNDGSTTEIRQRLRQMKDHEELLLARRTGVADFNYGVTLTTAGIAGVTGLALVTAAGRSVRRELVARRRAESQSEERRRQLERTLLGIGDAVICADPQGQITFMNPAAETITGWPAAEVTGLPLGQVFRIIHEVTRQPAASPAEEAIQTGRIVGLANPTLLITRDAREVAIDDSAAPIYDARHELTGVVLVFRDITVRRNVERLEAEQRRDLQENERRRDVFLAMLAHELRNPLAPLANCVELLSLQCRNAEEVISLCAVMSRQIELLVRLIDDLLDVSRMNHGIFNLRLERIDLNQSLLAAVDSVRPLLETQRHRFNFAPAVFSSPMQGDSLRLTQAISGLLHNAAKFTPPCGDIRLSIEHERRENVVRLQDSGIGIPASQLNRIFEMFVQLDESPTRKHGGLGVGLGLAKHIIDKHGGSITAHSAGPGRGSEFVVRLPISDAESEELVTNDSNNGTDSLTTPPLYNPPTRKILVVDDMKTAADMVTRLLILLGQRVRTTHDGQSALLALEEEPFDVLISDIAMPEMSGYELATRLRADSRHQGLVLIALTGYGQESDAKRARQAGFDHHIVKPVGIEQLRLLLSSLTQASAHDAAS